MNKTNNVDPAPVQSMVNCRYVLGFAFADDCEFVLMVNKQTGPEINIGKWNGVGGKVEEGETPAQAMSREFTEEANAAAEWEHFGRLSGDGWEVDLFRGRYEGEVPDKNDVGETLQFEEVASVMNPSYVNHYAQNVPTMVTQAAFGQGSIEMRVGN